MAEKCGYFDEKRCMAIGDSKEGKAARDKSCLNEFKDACCYSCDYKEKCNASCAIFDELSERDKNVLGLVPQEKWSTRNEIMFLGFVTMVVGSFLFIIGPNIFIILVEGAWLSVSFIGVVLAVIGFFTLLVGFLLKAAYK